MITEYKVKKRDNQVVEFNIHKIMTAITKAFGHNVDSHILDKIIKQVIKVLNMDMRDRSPIDIEKIQDAVEAALIIEGHREIGRNYILYRDEKMKEREQKLKLLEVATLTDVEKRYSYSALKIFKERYLLKDNEGKTCERLHELFERVAVASGIMDILYDEQFYDKEGKQTNDKSKHLISLELFRKNIADIDYKNINKTNKGIYSIKKIGKFIINAFHHERLMSRYMELVQEGKMQVLFVDIINELESNVEFQKKYEKQIQKYYDLMAHKIFLPNTPCLMNAGTKLGQLSACFVLGVEDDIRSIGDLYKSTMIIFKSGGGVGVNYSNLRPKGDIVKSTGGVSSGAISFMSVVNDITGVVTQGGKRKGANMGQLNIWHPESLEFIKLKSNSKKNMENFNISLNVNDYFFHQFFTNKDHTLWFKDNNHIIVPARQMMDSITQNAWETGDPGMVFYENMNKNNFLKEVFGYPINATNPCGEQTLYPNDSCTLGSINLTKFVEDGKFNTEKFRVATSICTQFLDGVLDANKYPLEEINEITKNCRRIGLGFMGLGDAMTQLGIAYNSEEGFTFAEYVTALMTAESLNTSAHMANVKGCFPYYYKEEYKDYKYFLPVQATIDNKYSDFSSVKKYVTQILDMREYFEETIPLVEYGLRNCNTTTIAPTGTLSMFADVTNGLEPIFSNSYTKKVTVGDFVYVNKHLVDALKKEGIYTKELGDKIEKDHNGMLSAIAEIPDHIKRTFITAMEIHPYDHLMMQAVCQRWITNAVAKTINAPNDINTKDIEYVYVLAWALGCKGTTIYRDGSKNTQVLNNHSIEKKKSNLKASDYTLEYIKSLSNIPEEYKRHLLVAGLPRQDGMTHDFAASGKLHFYNFGNVVTPTSTGLTVSPCPICGSGNSMLSNGLRCQICANCGYQLGCSTT